GKLEPLCQWLGVPRLAVIDVTRLGDCQLPERPARVAGLLLDRVADTFDFARWQTVLEPLWGVPVVGGLESLDTLRSAIGEVPPGESFSRYLCRTLGNNLLRYMSPTRLLNMAAQGDFSVPTSCESTQCAED